MDQISSLLLVSSNFLPSILLFTLLLILRLLRADFPQLVIARFEQHQQQVLRHY